MLTMIPKTFKQFAVGPDGKPRKLHRADGSIKDGTARELTLNVSPNIEYDSDVEALSLAQMERHYKQARLSGRTVKYGNDVPNGRVGFLASDAKRSVWYWMDAAKLRQK